MAFKIDIRNGFMGRLPSVPASKLPENAAQVAENCDNTSGKLRPLQGLGDVQTITKAGDIRTIFKMEDGTWLTWTELVDVVSSFATNSDGRIYYTDGVKPKQTNLTMAKNGAVDTYPAESWRLGLPVPTQALNLQINGTAGSTLLSSRSYHYTFVTEWGEESAPSPVSGTIDVYEGQTVTLSNFLVPIDTDLNITHIRIYRLARGASGVTDYQLVEEVIKSIPDYLDNSLDADLETDINRTVGWLPPPNDLKGLTLYANNILCGFKENTVYISVPGFPYAFPSQYTRQTADPIVGLVRIGGEGMLVMTEGVPYLITGKDPQFIDFTPFPYSMPSLSKRGGISFVSGTLYPSEEGMWMIDGPGTGRSLTEILYDKTDWNDLPLSLMFSFFSDNKLFMFFEGYSTGIWIPLTKDPQVFDISLPVAIYGGFYDGLHIYLLGKDGTDYKIYQWEGSDDALTQRWRGKVFRSNRSFYFGAGRVVAEGDVKLTVEMDGFEELIETLETSETFVVDTDLSLEAEVEVESESIIESIELATTQGELHAS